MTDSTPLLKEQWYGWRVIVKFDDEPRPRLIIPRSDPAIYEVPADGLFETIEEAVAWRDEELLDLEDAGDNEEIENVRSWVLTKLTHEQVSTEEQ